jgi:WD40 repeat protein
MQKHPSEPIFVTGCEDGGVRLFRVNNVEGCLELLRLVGRSDSRVLSVAFSPDGRYEEIHK